MVGTIREKGVRISSGKGVVMDWRCSKLICTKCNKRKKDCECPLEIGIGYVWCLDSYFIGNYCGDCKNKFECLTRKVEWNTT